MPPLWDGAAGERSADAIESAVLDLPAQYAVAAYS
jgi:hypothetical protein